MTLGWWCAFKNIDRDKIIKKLLGQGYVKLSDYRYNVGRSTIPVLKTALSSHNLPTKGKKADLVQKVLDNISEADCRRLFTQSYYVYSEKALDVIRKANVEAEAEYNRCVELVRHGAYDKLKAKLYPNRNVHWSTEDTFFDTLDFVMRHGFEGFDLNEGIRKHVSAFLALRAVDYSSRSYSACEDDIRSYLRSMGTDYSSLKLPGSLLNYAAENEIVDHDEMFDIYCQFIVNRARAVAELNNYRRLGLRKIKVDTAACHECGPSKDGKIYTVNKAPLLPSCWNCRCIYLSGH